MFYAQLPEDIQNLADKSYNLLKSGSPKYLVISRVYTKPGKGFSPLGEDKVYLAIQF